MVKVEERGEEGDGSFFNSHCKFPSSPFATGGGSTPLQEANGDVPLDGVAFSTELLEWGCIFNRVTRVGSQIFRFLG